MVFFKCLSLIHVLQIELSYFTLSNGFSAFKGSMILGELVVGEKCILNNLLVFENDCLPEIKPVWSGLIRLGITF